MKTWGNITDDARYVADAMRELGLTGDFADLTTDQMSAVLMAAAREKNTENVQEEQ